MKRILSYKLFEEHKTTELTKEQVEWLDKCTKGSWELNPETGLVDIDGNFRCDKQDLTDFKGVRFGTIGRSFSCINNQLSSLEGSPKEVGGDFDCSFNQLTSLEGAPNEVGEGFYCGNNQLTNLEGSPKIVGGNFYCRYNNLTSLKGAPVSIGSDFSCSFNQLTSLDGAPVSVEGGFFCHNNQLASLIGAPEKVGEDFWCGGNQLISLDGLPVSVGGGLSCDGNPVSEGALLRIYKLMKSGKSYPEALSEYWDVMPEDDKILMYADNPDLSTDEKRGYELRAKAAKRIY